MRKGFTAITLLFVTAFGMWASFHLLFDPRMISNCYNPNEIQFGAIQNSSFIKLVSLKPVPPESPWFDRTWGNRQSIVFSNSCVRNLAGQQVQITVNQSFDFNSANYDGSDIRFTAGDGSTLIPFRIIVWNPTVHTFTALVMLPSFSDALSATIYLYYGNPSATADASLNLINPLLQEGDTETPTSTDTDTPTPTGTETDTPTPTSTDTDTPTSTGTDTNTPTPTGTDTNTPTPTGTDTNTPTPTGTDTNTPTPTGTDTNTPTATGTDTNTPTATGTNTNTPTSTGTNTNTPTPTGTNTNTATSTGTNTHTPTPTGTNTHTPTPTGTNTQTPTPTGTNTQTPTPTSTDTGTPTPTQTNTNTASPTLTQTPSSTMTVTPTATVTPTPDLDKPVVSWVSPVTDAKAYYIPRSERFILLKANSTDNQAVDRVHFYRWDRVNLTYIDIGTVLQPPFQWNFDISPLYYGWNEIDVEAFDNAGNVSDHKYIFVKKIAYFFIPMIRK